MRVRRVDLQPGQRELAVGGHTEVDPDFIAQNGFFFDGDTDGGVGGGAGEALDCELYVVERPGIEEREALVAFGERLGSDEVVAFV